MALVYSILPHSIQPYTIRPYSTTCCKQLRNYVAIAIVTLLSPLFSITAAADTVTEHFNKGMEFYKAKHYDAAIDELEAARKLAPEDDTILNWIGWIDLSQGKYSEARGPLERAVKIKPGSVDYHLNLGNVYDGLKMYPDAVHEFEIITKLKPLSADAYYNLGSVYYKMQRSADAITNYRKATQLKPGDAYNWNGLGYVYQSTGRYSDAMAAYEQATRIQPNRVESATFFLNYSLAALAAAVKSRSLPGQIAKSRADADYEHARSALVQAVKLKPDDYEIRETYAETLYDVGKYADSIPEFLKASQLSGKPYDPYYNLGLAYEKLGKYADAAAAYKHAVELASPDSHFALFRLGEMQFKLAQYDDAAKSFTEMTKAEPDNLNAWINLASALHYKGDAEAETTILEEAVTKHTGDANKMARLRCALAYRYYIKGVDPTGPDPESLTHASEQYNEALKLSPSMPEALNGLGLIALRSNNVDEALHRFKQATIAKPTFADAFNNLGVAYKQKGDKAQARLNYTRALQIDPNNKLAKENLDNLK